MLFEHKIPTKQEASALVVLTIGVMIAMWKNNVAGSPAAITLCLIGTVCNAGMMSMSGTVLSGKVDALQLAFYTAPVSFTAILPVFLYREVTLTLLPCTLPSASLLMSQSSEAADCPLLKEACRS